MISKLIRLFLHILPLHTVCTEQRHFLSVRNSMFSATVSSVPPYGGTVTHLLTNAPEALISYGAFFPNDDAAQKMAPGVQSNKQSEHNNLIIPGSTLITQGNSPQPSSQEENSAEGYDEKSPPIPASTPIVREPAWLRSGKFQGDIDGVDAQQLRQLQNPAVQFNALRNRQLIWLRGVIPYELDVAFCTTLPGHSAALTEARLLQRVFRTYRRRTFGCIRFRPRRSGEADYLNIVKGNGCYSQVGKTGGKQELSLGRGCLFNETITHEAYGNRGHQAFTDLFRYYLMHSLGFWHEHSRADRDEHIIIRWENILPGMDSQFDVVSAAIQDTLGEPYDYHSIMHYGSSAFSRNGRNTLEAVEDEFTNVIGTAMELSEMDVTKIMKLYRCRRHGSSSKMGGTNVPSSNALHSFSPWRKRKITLSSTSSAADRHQQLDNHHNQSPPSSPSSTPRPFVDDGEDSDAETVPMILTGDEENAEFGGGVTGPTFSTTTRRTPVEEDEWDNEQLQQESARKTAKRRRTSGRCRDHFLDCPQFRDYCKRISFYFIMRSYCPHTCGRCSSNSTNATRAMEAETAAVEEDESEERSTTTNGKRKRAAAATTGKQRRHLLGRTFK